MGLLSRHIRIRPISPLTPDITLPFFEQLVLELQHGHLDNDWTLYKPMT
jgi:hypothetical protein